MLDIFSPTCIFCHLAGAFSIYFFGVLHVAISLTADMSWHILQFVFL